MIDRALIIGCGSIAKRHLRILRSKYNNLDIRVLRLRQSEPLPECADAYVGTIEEACIFGPNISIIASPANFHIAQAISLAKVGSHLLIEKPITDISNFDTSIYQLLEIGKINQLVMQVGYNLRYSESLREFKRLLDQNLIGRVYSLRCKVSQFLPEWRPAIDYRDSVSANSDLGGGVLLELSHEIDYLGWIFGEFQWVSAWLGSQGGLSINAEDMALLNFSIKSNKASNHSIVGTLEMDFARRDSDRSCVAIGENGSLRWDGLKNSIEQWSSDGTCWTSRFHSEVPGNESYILQMDHFIDRVLREDITVDSIDKAISVMKVIRGARSSMDQNGSRVDLV